MKTDRYLRIILTIIAIELAWLGFKDSAPAVAAQAEPARVIIASVDGGFLPVALAGQTVMAGRPPLRPIQVGVTGEVAVRSPIKVEIDRPLKVEADRPLKVESVPYTPGARPGE